MTEIILASSAQPFFGIISWVLVLLLNKSRKLLSASPKLSVHSPVFNQSPTMPISKDVFTPVAATDISATSRRASFALERTSLVQR